MSAIRPCLLSSVVLAFVSAQSGAQSSAPNAAAAKPETTVTVQVKVVNVLATVRDKHGQTINTLGQDDFALTEDGRPQAIHYFTRETDLPLSLGLLVDTSLSQRRVLEQERAASRSFLDDMVRADQDKAFVIHFDHDVELLQDLTGSHEKLESAMAKLYAPQFSNASGGDPQDRDSPDQRSQGRHRMGAGTLLYDAIYLASDELMRKQQGRKALIVLTDGVDRGSKETLEETIETALRADTSVYAILYKDDEQPDFAGHRGGFGMGGPMGGGGMGRRGAGGYPQEQRTDGKKILARITQETGGRLFEVSKKQTIDQIYSQIEEELRNQYNLGYTPDRGGAAEAGYHQIQLTAKPKDLVVQSRQGYYGSQ